MSQPTVLGVGVWTDYHAWWGGQTKGTTRKENMVRTNYRCLWTGPIVTLVPKNHTSQIKNT
jgi:hypothetical protein